jgi:acyl-CoA thioesterase
MDLKNTEILKSIAGLMEKDHFSNWLGIEILETLPGECTIKMKIRKEMSNGFGIAHGGIAYSFADSALAFASNSYDQPTVSFETSISHIKPLHEGDTIIARAKELSRGKYTGVYEVRIENENAVLVAVFKGTVFIRQSS